jgi:signal transduction histidine kinase
MKEHLFNSQYNSVVLNTLNQQSSFIVTPLDSAYFEFDAIALHNIPAFDPEIPESAKNSAGRQLKEVFQSLLLEYQNTRESINLALKKEGLDTSFNISYRINYIEIIDFDRRIPVFGSRDSMNIPDESSGLYLRTYNTEQNHFAAEFDLYIDFTRKAEIIMAEMKGLLIIVIVTLIIVLTAFVLTLRSLWKQKRLNLLKSDFIDNISHEFKTPLSSISLAATSIKHPSFNSRKEKITELANTILHQNKTLNNMIDQVIDVSLIENQEIMLNREPVDIFDYLEQTKSRLIKEHPEKSIKLDAHWNINNDLKLSLDRSQIDRVMSNLFSNAVKYSNGSPSICIRAKENGEFLNISIIDKGIGIEKEKLNQIFNRFYRVENGRSKAKGLGLGLYIVKKIVEAHHGEIEIESTPGKGTSVNFSLPKK